MAQSVEPQMADFVHGRQERTMNKELESTKNNLLAELEKRVVDKILERSNADLLGKLITNAESVNEAIAIAQLGTTYKKTGLHYDKRLEKQTSEIKYFKKNEELSFSDGNKIIPHKLIIGDNYDALRNLLIQYRGKVDVIYIDPPYGKDSMGEFAKTNYENTISRDNLLSMLYPRLVLAKQLLAPEGIIFCSIDDRNHAYVKCLFDDVFEESNFEGQIHWRRRHNQPNDRKKLIGIVAEHILAYSKDIRYHKEYGVGKVGITGTFTNPDNDPRGPWASKPWKTGGNQGGSMYKITSPTGKVFYEEWMGDENTYKQLLEDKRIYFPNNGNSAPRKKYYEHERKEEGQCAINWWPNDRFGCNQDATDELKSIFDGETPLDNPKPTKLIKALIKLGTIKEEAIILDFFAGSGTTAHAVNELNREGYKHQCILCQLNEATDKNPHGIALDVTAPRLKRIMTGSCYTPSDKYPFYSGSNDFPWLKDNEIYGGSLDVYELDTVSDSEHIKGKTAFDVIDETLYGKAKFERLEDKIQWVCEHFDVTEKSIESDKDWIKRVESK